MSDKISLSRNERQALVQQLVNQADNAPPNLGARGYMAFLIRKTNWPDKVKARRANGLTGDPEFDSQGLVDYALDQGTNPEDEDYTYMAGLLEALIDDLDLEGRRWVAALIAAHGLYRDESLLDRLMMRYQVPQAASAIDQEAYDYGPEIDWQGPAEQVELQSFGRPEPDLLDVGFLMHAIKRSASVCRVEIPEGKPEGTGFLIAPTLLLTNYHVLDGKAGLDIVERARAAVLRFGNVLAENGEEAKGQTFRVAGEPVVVSSPTKELDYALLRVEDRIRKSEGIEPAPYTLDIPFKGMAINILQHAGGKALKLALSDNGVDRVFEERGIVQYSTRAIGGSSGSPCFTDNWEVIALHHAGQMRAFGQIREGIILKSIYQEIKQHL